MKRIVNQLLPFFLIGIAIVAFAFGIMLLAYLFLFGAIIGFILFFIFWIRDKFFPAKPLPKRTKSSGRTFDSDDWTRL